MSPLNDSDGGSFSVREPIVALSKSRGSDNRISLPVSVSAASHAPLRSLVRCTTWKPSHTSQNSEHTSISPTIRRRLSERVITTRAPLRAVRDQAAGALCSAHVPRAGLRPPLLLYFALHNAPSS